MLDESVGVAKEKPGQTLYDTQFGHVKATGAMRGKSNVNTSWVGMATATDYMSKVSA